jgi:hypothetical protein
MKKSAGLRWIIACCLVLAAALALAVDTYRGGIEAGEELTVFAASIAACLIAGILIRSPWALLLAAAPPLVAFPIDFLTWLAMLYLASPAYLFFLGLGALAGTGHWKAAAAVTLVAAAAIGYVLVSDEEVDDQRGADELEREIERIDAARHRPPLRIVCIRFSGGAGNDVSFRCDAFGRTAARRYEVRVERQTGRFHIRGRRNHPAAQGCCIELD